MFKSTRKRSANRITFEEQLNQQLNHLKQQTPQKSTNLHKNKQIATIIDQVVNELKTPIQPTPKKESYQLKHQKYNQIHQMQSLKLDENSSISLHSKEGLDYIDQEDQNINKIYKNHISNLVSHSEIVKMLVDNFNHYTQNESIKFYDFIKKIYLYYFDIELRQQEVFLLKSKLTVQLTTTDPEYLSLNALQIIAKRHNIKKYLQSIYMTVKIDQKILQYQKRNKKLIQQLNKKQDCIKERQLRLNLDEEQYEKKLSVLMNKEKNVSIKQKELILKQKELKKSIEQKTMKLYEAYVVQFSQKTKQIQKRLNNTEKNIKYKIEILQRRSQGLKILINEKNDLKNKKIMSQNDAKIKLRRIQKEMDQLEKKHQSEIEIFEKQQKDLMKSISILQQKLTKSERKNIKQKERILQLEQELTISSQKFEKLVQKCSDMEHLLQANQQQPKKSQQFQMKLQKQKTSRSSKGKKRIKSSQLAHILPLYQTVLHSINCFPAISHFQYQQLIQQVMKLTVKELPQLICLLTAFEDESDPYKEPHYLVLNIAKIVINQFYFLNNKQEQPNISRNSKFRTSQIQELLKYPYAQQTNLSILLLFLQIYDWDQEISASFFSKSLQIVIQQIQNNSILKKNQLKTNQIMLITSPQCLFFLINIFFTQIVLIFETLEKSPRNWLKICIGIIDLFLVLTKEQGCMLGKLSENNIQYILTEVLIKTIEGILSVYNVSNNKNKWKNGKNAMLFESIQQIEEFAQKMSIFMQRFYYKFQKKMKKNLQIKRMKVVLDRLQQLNRSNGNRQSLILANLKSIIEMGSDAE